ncbi:Mitotic checkpoint serine/threonine-protein kinase BUB1 [Ananas comosus]|uniref:Mitotic checkpoint serine/threonine-protein kinase BUB1 n=1 Tax=Ananas comosus TaxID=4615 RepID=A0A199W795_ANACO|nr:Mitotic checkpoint serine/threonine-protein kinase BUB1 [Ananas comosus]
MATVRSTSVLISYLSSSSSSSPRSIRKALDELRRDPNNGGASHLKALVEDCIEKFGSEERYRDDARLLKIWILHADEIRDFDRVFRMLEQKGICQGHALLYEAYALFLVAKGNLLEAEKVYQLGISRNAEPLDKLKKMHAMFLNHVSEIAQNARPDSKVVVSSIQGQEQSLMNPWSASTITDLLRKKDSDIKKYNHIKTLSKSFQGYHKSNKVYSGKISLTSLQNSSRNKVVELGNIKYHIKGCSGQGGFAQVYKAYVDGNPEDVVALKIQKPAYPWEFYMYRQLDQRVSAAERPNFGYAHKVHVFSDLSVLVCEYLSHGTLQDAINSHLVMNKLMEELLCIYYTREMLRMLETLHSAGIIHGDFKPDNLLVRYSREDLTEDKEKFKGRTGSWHDQGLCLVDWGRGIDLNLFPADVEFQGDCRTSGFRCVEMQERRTWTYQVDTYGLCVIAHMMLHGTYMSIEKKTNADGSYLYQPKSSLKRY